MNWSRPPLTDPYKGNFSLSAKAAVELAAGLAWLSAFYIARSRELAFPNNTHLLSHFNSSMETFGVWLQLVDHPTASDGR